MGSYLAEVLPYWHEHIDRPELPAKQRFRAWYQRDNNHLEAHFADLVATLLAEPSGARDIPNTAATVIVLDQFPRKLYPGGPEAYSGHDLAAAIVRPLLHSGKDRQLEPIERIALAMSLSNTEQLSHHDACLQWFAQQVENMEGEERALFTDFRRLAEERRDIIRQFGRFPVRNQPLGRNGTPGEAYFVATSGLDFE